MENRASIVRDLGIMGLTMSYSFLLTVAVKQIFRRSRYKCCITRYPVFGIERVVIDIFDGTIYFYSCQLTQKFLH
jgi:hypothetical protein